MGLFTLPRSISPMIFRGKRMCCRPFQPKNLALQETSVTFHVHLYDDIEGNSEWVKRREGQHEYVPAHMEQQVIVKAAEGDLIMTCYVNETIIGRRAVVSNDRLMRGAGICEPFVLDFPNQPDSVIVSLRVGHNTNQEVLFLFRMHFSTPHRTERASPQDPGELVRAMPMIQVLNERINEWMDTSNEEEGQEEEEEYYSATESLPHETGELVRATLRIQALNPGRNLIRRRSYWTVRNH